MRPSEVSGTLRSKFRVEDTAVVCVGVAVAAASMLHWQPDAPASLSTVRPRETTAAVSVDREHVAAAVLSERHFQVNGQAAGAGFTPHPPLRPPDLNCWAGWSQPGRRLGVMTVEPSPEERYPLTVLPPFEALKAARPAPSGAELAIEGLTDEEWDAFLQALAER